MGPHSCSLTIGPLLLLLYYCAFNAGPLPMPEGKGEGVGYPKSIETLIKPNGKTHFPLKISKKQRKPKEILMFSIQMIKNTTKPKEIPKIPTNTIKIQIISKEIQKIQII